MTSRLGTGKSISFFTVYIDWQADTTIPYAGVNYILPVRDYEFGYRTTMSPYKPVVGRAGGS